MAANIRNLEDSQKLIFIESKKLTEDELKFYKYVWMLGKEDLEEFSIEQCAVKYNGLKLYDSTATDDSNILSNNTKEKKQKIKARISSYLKDLKLDRSYSREVWIALSNDNYEKCKKLRDNPGNIEKEKENKKLAQAEELIAKWSCENAENNPESQSLLNIDRYYDFYTGMTPYVEVYFRTGIKNENGVKEAVWTSINSVEHPFISNINVKDNGIKTVTVELYDKDFASYSKFAIRKDKSFLNKGNLKDEYYSLDQLIKATLRNDFSSNTYNTNYKDERGTKELDISFTAKYINVNTNKQEEVNISYKIEDANMVINSGLYASKISKTDKQKITKDFKDWKKRQASKKEKYYYKDKISENQNIGSSEETELDGNYLKMIDENDGSFLSTTNLKIRFGYVDYNRNMTDTKLSAYFTDKKSEVTINARDARWWNMSNDYGEDWSVDLHTWIGADGKILTASETKNKKNNNVSTEGHNNYTEDGKFGSIKKQMESADQTTQATRSIELMITGYKSTLTATGIKYTLTCIEAKEAKLMRKRFLQRFSEIVDYPEGVLYSLMRMFNEYNGEPLDKDVKIVFMQDEYDDSSLTKNLLVQKYDLKNLTEEERKNVTYTDTFNAVRNGESIRADLLAKISLGLGSEASLSNYRQISENPPLTKSVAALISEFCAACPPKKLEQTVKKVYDENGEEVRIDPNEQTARPLKWFSVFDDGKSGESKPMTYIVLYYRKQLKPKMIRQYYWGPNLPFNSCVKQINIENKNEFALLSSVKTFNSADGTVNSRINSNNINTTDNKYKKETEEINSQTKIEDVDKFLNSPNTKEYDIIANSAVTGAAYDIALSSGVYEGSIDILGDPFFLFNGIMQPCTYPIRLNVLVPKNETELRTKGKDEDVIKQKHINLGTNNDFYGNTQRYHELSGYYLIKEIEHNITPNSFTTKLNILSYPNIEKQILIENMKPDPIGENC